MSGPSVGPVLHFMYKNPVRCYFGGAFALGALRFYQTRTTYNYWFGKNEYLRRLERG